MFPLRAGWFPSQVRVVTTGWYRLLHRASFFWLVNNSTHTTFHLLLASPWQKYPLERYLMIQLWDTLPEDIFACINPIMDVFWCTVGSKSLRLTLFIEKDLTEIPSFNTLVIPYPAVCEAREMHGKPFLRYAIIPFLFSEQLDYLAIETMW